MARIAKKKRKYHTLSNTVPIALRCKDRSLTRGTEVPAPQAVFPHHLEAEENPVP